MRKFSWVWLLSLVLLFAFSGLTLAADDQKEATQPVKVEEKGLLWVGGAPRAVERTQLDEVVEYLNETFDTGIPATWTTAENNGSTIPWDTLSEIGWGSGAAFITETPPFAAIDSDAEGSVQVDADLITPEIVIPANTYLECFMEYDLSFRHYGADAATFSYTIDGGTTWVEVWTTSTTNYDSQVFDILDIVGAAGGTIQFKWNYVANYSYHMAIDNVYIVGTDEDIRSPQISVLEAPSDLYAGWDADFIAVVSDPSGIASANLNYHQWDDTNDTLMVGGYSGTVAMTVVNGDTMAATILGDAAAFAVDDMVAFWFDATDSAPGANAARLPESETSYYGYDIIDDLEAPDVEPVYLTPFAFIGDDADFEFEITDDNGVAAATFYYAEFDTTEANYGPVSGGISGSVDMTLDNVDDNYFATIASTVGFLEGDFVGYYLEVTDGWSTPNSAILPDTTETGDPVYMLYEYLAIPDIISDFEADQGPFESSDETVWQWGNPEGSTGGEDYSGNPYPAPEEAYSGTNVWATVVDGPYDSNMDGYLTTTTAWALDANASLRFVHWFHTESWDGHNVQISLDLGETWTVIDPVGGYNDDSIQGLDGDPGWNKYDYAYWNLATFDLSAYEGEIVMFRLRFGSDSSGERYGAAIDDFMFWGALVPGELDGTVADATDDPIEGASITVYIADTDVEVARTETNRIGYYNLHPLPGTYDVVARSYGYLNAIAEDVVIAEDALTTADIVMTEGVETDTLKGTVWGDMDMTTPVSNVAVSVPSEYFNTFTGADGAFNFGEVDHGPYTIVLSHVPAGYMGYHDVYLMDYEVTDRTLPLDLYMPEILPPTALGASAGDGEVTLVWDAPADYFDEEEFEALPERLANLHEQLEYVINEGTEEEQAKLPLMREELFRAEQALLRHRAAELDQITDFAGYRIMLNGTIWNDEPIEATEFLVDGLRNGLEYEVQVAADYGYHDDFLVWSDPVLVRPLPTPGYIIEETDYNWVELNPAEGGVGTVWMDSGDDANTGLTDMGLTFNFYGNDYTQLAACSNGWLSFTDGTTIFGLTLTLPSGDLPNATLAPLNEDTDMEEAGDAYAIYSYLDATANKFYVQYNTRHYFNTADEYIYQMILDANDNTIYYQYKAATTGWNANSAVVGIENEDGTIASVFNAADLVDEMALHIAMEGGEKGNIQGNITSNDTGDPVAGALVKATCASGHTFSTVSDENGDYALLLLNKDDAPYDLLCRAEGYYDLEVEDVDWLETEDFVHYEDLAIDELDPDAPPRVTNIDENYDDRFVVSLGAPGSMDETAYLQYDDGTMASVYAWTSTPEPSFLAGTGFNVDGAGVTVLGLEVHCGIDYSGASPFPDATHEDVVFNLLEDDNGTPGAIIWTSEPVEVDAISEWAVVTPNIPVPSTFYVMMSNPTPAIGQEGITVDGSNEHQNYWYNAGAGWNHLTTASGDPLMRAMVSYVPGGGGEPLVEMVGPENPEDYLPTKGAEISMANNALNTPVYGLSQIKTVYAPNYNFTPASSSLDEVGDVIWFMVQYSLDGVAWTTVEVDGDTLINPAEPNVPVILGSDEENTEYMFRASAWMTDPDGLLDSLQSQWVDGVATFNMPPAAPEDMEADVDGLDITLTFAAPTTNGDGTDIVDLAGYTAWTIDGETYTEVGTSTVGTEEITFTVAETAIYLVTVTASDEVPNVSDPAMPISVMAGDAGISTSFEDGEWNNMTADAVWEHGAPTAGPGEASDGVNVWATYLGGEYAVGDAGMLYTVEPITVTSENSMMVYDHWFEYEMNWDGYTVLASSDEGASWVTVEPLGGFPSNAVDGLGDLPGFSGTTTDWQTVFIPLGQFNGENIILAFAHGSDDISVTYYGAAIDNLSLYDAAPPVYGSVTSGTDYLSECTVDGTAIAGAEIWAEGWPVMLGVTAADGTFDVACPVGTWNIMFVHEDYWTITIADVVVVEGTPVALAAADLVMTYPEAAVTPTSTEVAFDLISMDPVTETFTLENVGCGPMEYFVSAEVLDNLHGGNNGNVELPERRESVPEAKAFCSDEPRGPVASADLDDLWDVLLADIDIEGGTGGQDNFGVGMGSSSFYIAGFFYGTLTTFDYDGNYVDQVNIDASMGGSNYDGVFGVGNDPDGYLYAGNNDGNVFKFTPDMTSVEAAGSITGMAVSTAYDWDNGNLYVCEWGDPFYKIDAAGTVTPLSGASATINGLAYVPMDEDGFTIYGHTDGADASTIIRYNPDTGVWDETPVTNIYALGAEDSAGDMAAGLRGETFDFMTVKQGGTSDTADLWEGYTLQQWIFVEPAEGTLAAASQQQITVTIDPAADDSFNPEEGTQTTVYVSVAGPHMDTAGILITIEWQGDAPEASDLPTRYALHQNYPNPFNPTTAIKFDLVEAQSVKLTVYNMLGQEVTRLVNTRMNAGFHTVTFDATSYASGVYFYRLETPAYTSMKKMVMVK